MSSVDPISMRFYLILERGEVYETSLVFASEGCLLSVSDLNYLFLALTDDAYRLGLRKSVLLDTLSILDL